MAYPGNPELSPQAQDRVMTAFKQVVDKLQHGNREEALIGLEFVLRLDPAYLPARNLHQQLSSGAAEIDLNEIISQLEAPTTETINTLVVEAVEDFNNREFAAARAKVQQVLLDLPGHQEARALLAQIEEADSGSSQVERFLAQARDALADGNTQEAANFVMMAQALDPHHEQIATTLGEIERQGDISLEQAGFVGDPAATQKIDFESSAGGDAPDFGAADAADLFSDTAPATPRAASGDAIPEPDFEPPSPPSRPPTEERAAAGADYYESGSDNVSELFESSPTAFETVDPGEAAASSDADAVIRELLAKGGAAAAEDNYVAAIDAWSRILLIDPKHEEALDRIKHIRHAKEELERRIEPMLDDAAEALEGGDVELARNFGSRVLSLWPKHVETTRLMEKIGRATPSEPNGDGREQTHSPEMPELEDDLFSDDFTATSDFGAAAQKRAQRLEGEWRTPAKPKRKLPWQWWVGLGAAGVVVVAVSLWVAGVFAPAEPAESRFQQVNRVLTEAEELFNQKKIDEAIVLLEENSADDQYQGRVDAKLTEYRKMVATPVPTPVPPGLAACRQLVDEGRWLAAYDRIMAELRIAPNDPALEALRQQVSETEPEAPALHQVFESNDFRAAIAIIEDLLEENPEHEELPALYDRALFNAGLAEMRAFNLPAAEAHLQVLLERHPGDEEVTRMLEFIELYKSRPVDMQLEIFVGSIDLR